MDILQPAPRSHQDEAPDASGQDHGIRDQVGRPPVHVSSRCLDAARDGGNQSTGK
jgi:hypothetical protein